MKLFLFFSIAFFFIQLSKAQSIDLVEFQDGFTKPLDIQNAGDDRLFIVEQTGRIIIIDEGVILNTPFLDLSENISVDREQGLLGLAFHPNYASNGFFYVNYTNPEGNTHISRFHRDEENPNKADPTSELLVLNYDQPELNHNGGNLIFGPDGFLYISSGDGGEFEDPNHRAQRKDQLLGKILRIDVDRPSNGKEYGIPADNPFIDDDTARPEIWAYGLRNPWRFAFGDEHIWIADVGQANREEINKQLLNSGGLNYGWRCYEGSLAFNTSGCPDASDLVFPIHEYDHTNDNCSVSGGKVYRGTEYPILQEHYFFADYCSGNIWSIDTNENLKSYGSFSGRFVAFGEDNLQNLYVADIDSGKIYKIVETSTAHTETLASEDVKIFPNPAQRQFKVFTSSLEIFKISIFDAHGRIIPTSQSAIDRSIQVNIEHLESGIYFVKIETTSAQSFKKLIIQ